MSSNLTFHSANDLPIGQRATDGYINATALCKAAGKKWSHYYANQTTKEYLKVLGNDLNLNLIEKNPSPHIGVTALIQVFQGGDVSQQGTWVHPKVALHLANWLSARKSKNQEKDIQNRLAIELAARVEVPTAAGNIDLLTFREIIEIKEVSNWKTGIGQLMVYGSYFPNHQKVLYLFGFWNGSSLVIQEHCNRLGIKLLWE